MAFIADEVWAVLGCPHCKAPLQAQEAQTRVTCAPCRLSWPVEEGIPRLAPEHAVAEPPVSGT
ncbi:MULTISPECIES: Trm112 family protein [unclassified Myxococcus]|uniref:Trm112 family protein n=1 Tax=Myxococcus sp. AB056 TaxID=2562792 RepID=UPI001147459D